MILRVWEISDKGFMVNQHSKRVTKPKYELQLHLVLQQYIVSGAYAIKKNPTKVIFIGDEVYDDKLLLKNVRTCFTGLQSCYKKN